MLSRNSASPQIGRKFTTNRTYAGLQLARECEHHILGNRVSNRAWNTETATTCSRATSIGRRGRPTPDHADRARFMPDNNRSRTHRSRFWNRSEVRWRNAVLCCRLVRRSDPQTASAPKTACRRT